MHKYHCNFILTLFLTLFVTDSIFISQGDKLSSSVWCTSNKLCTFQNLCYQSESHQFLFVLSEQSIFQGLSYSDLNTLELSSVYGHNRMFMSLTVISYDNELLAGAYFINESLFAINSFKQDNIFHVIHDDLLPLFSTYLILCGGDIKPCVEKYRLTFTNGQDVGPYKNWYNVFTKQDPLLLSLSDHNTPMRCYREVRTGLVRSSLWFDYGFTGVQGRLKNPKISGQDIRKFREFVLNALNVAFVADEGCAVIVKRTLNRRIINDQFVRDTILETMKTILHKENACLIELDLLKDSAERLVTAVYQSNVFVGMHGAAMGLTVFLPVGATILEMFPFAIEPLNVSPIMAMCDLDDIGLHYVFWRNRNRSLSIPPNTTDPLGGSISHLPIDERNEILQLEKVNAVPCCHDPAYLYYMFQDTIVGPDFTKTLLNALRHSQDFYEEDFIFDSFQSMRKQWMSPGPVYNTECSFNDNCVQVSWHEPVNSAEFELLEFDVLAISVDQPVFTGSVESTYMELCTPNLTNLKLWICAKDVAGSLKSKDVFTECLKTDK